MNDKLTTRFEAGLKNVKSSLQTMVTTRMKLENRDSLILRNAGNCPEEVNYRQFDNNRAGCLELLSWLKGQGNCSKGRQAVLWRAYGTLQYAVE